MENARPALDPFGHGDGEYGGRVPYRSRYDLEKEAAEKQQREARQAAQQAQAAAQQQAAYQQQMAYQQQAYTQPVNNVVPFPGMQRGPDGSVYSHVEYVVLLRNRNECKDVIAYIKSNASVFLNMEFIASDSERQRCVDMLSGAAYTLGCSLNKISPRGIYLISAPTVRVVLDPAMQKFAAAPESQGFVRQRYENDGYGAQQQPVQPQETTRQQPVSGFFLRVAYQPLSGPEPSAGAHQLWQRHGGQRHGYVPAGGRRYGTLCRCAAIRREWCDFRFGRYCAFPA